MAYFHKNTSPITHQLPLLQHQKQLYHLCSCKRPRHHTNRLGSRHPSTYIGSIIHQRLLTRSLMAKSLIPTLHGSSQSRIGFFQSFKCVDVMSLSLSLFPLSLAIIYRSGDESKPSSPMLWSGPDKDFLVATLLSLAVSVSDTSPVSGQPGPTWGTGSDTSPNPPRENWHCSPPSNKTIPIHPPTNPPHDTGHHCNHCRGKWPCIQHPNARSSIEGSAHATVSCI